MIFYCPNCNTLEIGEDLYGDNDVIAINYNDDPCTPFYYVACNKCGYPLSAFSKTKNETEKQIERYKNLMTKYQDGSINSFFTRNHMLDTLKEEYQTSEGSDNWKRHHPNDNLIDICNKFYNK